MNQNRTVEETVLKASVGCQVPEVQLRGAAPGADCTSGPGNQPCNDWELDAVPAPTSCI